MMLDPAPRSAPMPALPGGVPRRPPERGQAMVEFAAVLLPLLFVVVAIVQFGLLFGANVSLTNAAREGARAATIYRYDSTATNKQHGVARCSDAVEATKAAFGFMSTNSPHFSASATCPNGIDLNGDNMDDLWQNGDVEVSFCAGGTAPGSACPNTADSTTYCTTTSGLGCLVRVQLSYNQAIVVPLLGPILDGDGNKLFELKADASMVMN
jgi:Flp pilus assembly protein TadG